MTRTAEALAFRGTNQICGGSASSPAETSIPLLSGVIPFVSTGVSALLQPTIGYVADRRLARRSFMAAGFVLITLATIAGTTWGFIEAGAGWIRDPRISISFITWGIVLAMVFLRVSAGWRGRKAAIMAIAALGCAAITWVAHTGMRLSLTQ